MNKHHKSRKKYKHPASKYYTRLDSYVPDPMQLPTGRMIMFNVIVIAAGLSLFFTILMGAMSFVLRALGG